jgi:membrane associated rhomboid family serine protease
MHLFSVGSSVNPTDPLSILGIFSHIFGHISIEHLLGNLTFILLLGPIVEEKYGSRNLMTMIIITAFVTGMLNVLLFNTGLIGASGIVFMLILLVSFTNVNRGEIPLSFIFIAILFIGKEILQSFSNDQISQFAHIIGGVCGSVFGFKARG